MIAFFPKPYTDELLYSVLARYLVRSGYIHYIFAAEDLFADKKVRPDIEFVNKYTSDLIKRLTKIKPMKDWVLHHTMYPYYARFLPNERKVNAFNAMVNMKGGYHNLLAIPNSKNGKGRYLRYCPICVTKDRTLFGETYWHRQHQLMFIDFCPIHGCKLINSDVQIGGRASPGLTSAEEVVAEETAVYGNEIEQKLSSYVGRVFSADMGFDTDIPVGQFLHYRLLGTPYHSIKGDMRNIKLLQKDFSEYYKDIFGNYFHKAFQLEAVSNQKTGKKLIQNYCQK